jgi:type I restriction enzyme, S subunit
VSRIDELVSEMCPRGVEIRRLGQVGTFTRGNGLQKKDFVDSGVGCIHYGQIYTHYGTSATATKSFVAPEMAARLRMAKPGDLVVATTSENDEDVCKAVAWLGQAPVAVSGDAYVYSHTLEPKYVSYFFQSRHFQDQKAKFINGTKVKRVSGENLGRISLPLPPIEVQREVVRVLDKFAALETDLEVELKAELEARRRQYAHYRGALFGFADDESVGWSALGALAVNHDSRRRPVTKAAREAGDIPYYGASGVVDWVSDYIFDGDYLLVSEDGANLLARSTPIAFAISGRTWVNNHAHILEFSSYAERRFVEFYLNSIDLAPYVSGAAQPKLNQANLNRIPIPVPSADEMQRIVEILDHFEALVSDLSVGLPAELAARRKQYEHYRDRLLTFPEAS